MFWGGHIYTGVMAEEIRETVRRHVLAEHRDTVADVCSVGRTVSASWSTETVPDPERVTTPLASQLTARGLDTALLDALATAVAATDATAAGTPVPAPPYFVVTSRGPLCRATLDDDRRLVVRLRLFTVERRPRAYRFRDPRPETCLKTVIRDS
ncbi:hypothetical protein SAMN05216226_101346 [Halovenus aranensis]|jgi:hypothetical protein|uniref:DUF7988 domain-containing protein n=2 Tax=Halovenus aranensis TaxID=890420 RepID=A0A1G8S8D3_9EURY|nr:hypothetical protein SAMN05216226_101346 [Halovenus aranensis]